MKTTWFIVAVSFAMGQIGYGYDAASRLQTVSQSSGQGFQPVSATYRYVSSSPLVESIAFTNNGAARMTITKSYDLLDRLTAIETLNSQPSTINSFQYGYNNASLRTAITNEANAYWVYEYDNLGHVKSGRRYWADGTSVAGQQYEFGYDDIGNVLAAGTGGDQSGLNLRWTSNTFNTLNQITGRTTPGYVESFGTAHSNATVTVNLQPTYRHGEYFRAELAVDNTAALWQGVTNIGVLNDGTNPDIVTTNLSSVFVPAALGSLLHDPDGNLTNDGRFTYIWNSENQLTRVESLTNTPAESRRKLTFDYDALGRRIRAGVSRWTNSNWLVTSSNKFLYDGWTLVAELNATNNTLIRSYAWGLDLSGTMQGAGGVGGLLWVNDAGTLGSNSTHLAAFDGNGNVSALVDSGNGAETARYEYGPFGDLTQASGPMGRANPIRFSSKYHDDATGLIYYGYRYYSPGLQRWLSRDPLGEDGGLNLYGFVGNDPVNATDALGLVSSLNFVPASELAWMLGGSAVFDTALSIGMQKLTADPCKEKWLDWGQVGTEVGTGAALTLGTFGLSKLYDVYQAAKVANLLRHAENLRELGRYDELAEMVALHGDEFSDALAAYKRANAAFRQGNTATTTARRSAAATGDAAKAGTTLDASQIRFSQSSVKPLLSEYVEKMKAGGWFGNPIDVVRMPDGGLTSIDNTRLAAASITKTPVQANIWEFGDAFPASRGPQFFDNAQTWGDAVLNRIVSPSQNPKWQALYPNGSPFTGIRQSTPAINP